MRSMQSAKGIPCSAARVGATGMGFAEDAYALLCLWWVRMLCCACGGCACYARLAEGGGGDRLTALPVPVRT